jgi:hypothetical protein
MAGDEEDPRSRFRLIDGLPAKPRPGDPSWPRRYRVVRMRRSVRRPRSGGYRAEYLEKIGVLAREVKPGTSRKRRMKKRKAPPLRTLERMTKARLQSASPEEFKRLVADAWKNLMGLRDDIRFGTCLDPDGSSDGMWATGPYPSAPSSTSAEGGEELLLQHLRALMTRFAPGVDPDG